MGLRIFDSFDSIPAGKIPSAGYASAVDITTSADTPHGYGQSLGLTNDTATSGSVLNVAPGQLDGFVIGMHFKKTLDGGGTLVRLMYENGLNSIVSQGQLVLNGQRGLTWQRPDGSVAFMTDPNLFYPGVWYYLELKGKASTGFLELRLDEEVVLPWQNVGGMAEGVVNIIRFQRETTSPYGLDKKVDNLVVIDTDDGISPTDYLGDCVVFHGKPTADTATNDMVVVGVAGVDPGHFEAVDEVTSDDDTTYLLATAPDLEEEFAIEDLPIETMDVLAVGIEFRAQKQAAGSATLVARAKIGTDVITADPAHISASYTTKLAIMPTKPGGGAWSVSDYNAMTASIETALPV